MSSLIVPAAVSSASLLEFQDVGGVLDYFAFDVVAEASSDELHQHAAREAGRSLPGKSAEPGPDTRISLKEFVGPFYDWEKHALIDPWQRTSGGGGSRSSNGEFITAGYADAFLDPPYSLTVPIEHISLLFEKINFAMFGGLGPELDIRKWPTDWSDYFDAGKEWWGAFFWTVYAPSRFRICAIAASTTD